VAALGLEEPMARHVKVAALLHDIGHGPFSHTWEGVFPAANHEEWGARIVTEDDELAQALHTFERGLPEVLVSFWRKTYRPSFARKLVSSQLDVDRLDYLLRDGHYSGAGYATYDLDWILHALRIEEVRSGDDPRDLVVDYRRGRFAVEQYLFARTYMYAQVYHHKTVRSAEWMFLKLWRRFAELAAAGKPVRELEPAQKLARGESITVDEYLALDDVSVTYAMDRFAGRLGPAAEDPILRDLSRRLVSRKLWKTVDLGDDPAVIDELKKPVEEAARKQLGDAAPYSYQFDTAEQIGYHAEDGEELFVVGHPRSGTLTLGQLLRELPLGRRLETVRLVCAPELLPALAPILERHLRKRAG
jgi:HD superfamily phosphohydrolase